METWYPAKEDHTSGRCTTHSLCFCPRASPSRSLGPCPAVLITATPLPGLLLPPTKSFTQAKGACLVAHQEHRSADSFIQLLPASKAAKSWSVLPANDPLTPALPPQRTHFNSKRSEHPTGQEDAGLRVQNILRAKEENPEPRRKMAMKNLS